jgi:hypothetical protein
VVDVTDGADVDVNFLHDTNSPVATSNQQGTWLLRPIAFAIFSPLRAKPERRKPQDAERRWKDTQDGGEVHPNLVGLPVVKKWSLFLSSIDNPDTLKHHGPAGSRTDIS